MNSPSSCGQGCRTSRWNVVEEALGFHFIYTAASQTAAYRYLNQICPVWDLFPTGKRHDQVRAYGAFPTASSLEDFPSQMWPSYLMIRLHCLNLPRTPGKLFTPTITLGKDLHWCISHHGGNRSLSLFWAWLLVSLHGASPLSHSAQAWFSTAWGGRFPTYESSTTLPRAFLDVPHSC